jgi:hypothetical protein
VFGAYLTNELMPAARSTSPIATCCRFEEFLREAPADRPIILAAHSQGSAHLLRLLAERIKGRPRRTGSPRPM